MKKYALVFSGQGSERVGMFNDLLKESNALEHVLSELENHLDIDLRNIITTRDSALVASNNQILLSIFHHLKTQLLLDKIGYLPTLFMGHSFGQFSALSNSGSISFNEMIVFLSERLRIINDPNIEVRASFKSLHGMTVNVFDKLKQDEKLCDDVELALHNQREQVVCAATEKGQAKLNELSGKYNYVLRDVHVSRPYHTSFMNEYNQLLCPHIDKLNFSKPDSPVLLNHSNEMTECIDTLRVETKIQMVKPVFWYDSVVKAAECVDAFVIIDPTETQLKIIRRITDKKIYNVSNMGVIKMIEKKGL